MTGQARDEEEEEYTRSMVRLGEQGREDRRKISLQSRSALLMTYSYAQKRHTNYDRCYKNYPMKVGEWVLR